MADPLDLDAAEKRADAASPGPWTWGEVRQVEEHWVIAVDDVHVLLPADHDCRDSQAEFDADKEFIAHARSDVPALVARVRQLEEALAQKEHVISFAENGWSIEHLVSCRPEMTACPIHQAAMEAKEAWTGEEYPFGRYRISLGEGGVLVVGEALGR